jgi:formylglycine-generating enzyme required for sulfatase activity
MTGRDMSRMPARAFLPILIHASVLTMLLFGLAAPLGCGGKDDAAEYHASKAMPRGWTVSTRKMKIATPQGKAEKQITYYRNSLGMEFVLIEPGEFQMGSPGTEAERYDREGPQHKVRITKQFFMGSTEVTQSQYKAVMGGWNPSYFKDGRSPVENVNWDYAVAFCKKLSERDGVRYRLPTEAEWEYACRAGTTTPFYTGETISTEQANYDGNYTYGTGRKGAFRAETAPVRSFPANPWGLHDMHGNVWEWCYDGMRTYKGGESTDPQGPITPGSSRVLRGGVWGFDPSYCRSALRTGGGPAAAGNGNGFRVVVVVAQ